MKILVTGAAGFIGTELILQLLRRGDQVVGVDNLNDYYEVSLKEARLERILSASNENFSFLKLDIANRDELATLFAQHEFDAVVNLAAQAGVRYSIDNPYAYIDSNIAGFGNILENCRQNKVGHLVFASSSSVYGANERTPFTESDNVDHPVSLYAAGKKSAELMAHSYASLFGLPCTGLRFFTVYGPWGRPDMAYFSFTRKILAGEPIPVFNNGEMIRDFTFIDDIVEGVLRVLDRPATVNEGWQPGDPDPATSYAPYRIYNIGHGEGVPLMEFVAELEQCLGKKANIDFLPMQAGDVRVTLADTTRLVDEFGYAPTTAVKEGVGLFTEWYREYYGV